MLEQGHPLTESASNTVWTRSWRLGHSGEGLLAWGVVLLVVSAVLMQQVMLGLLSFVIGPVALVCLLIAVLRARAGASDSYLQALGLILLLAGVVALAWVSVGAAGWGARQALQAQRIQQGISAVNLAGSSPGPSLAIGPWLTPLLIGIGLRFWGSWSSAHCLVWGGAVFLIPPAILLFFRVMGPRLALSA